MSGTDLPAVVCVMGPTASGKTDIAIALCQRFDVSVISVDSALVYRGMNIGTAKPDEKTLAIAPHRLIDIRDPEDNYSAGDFVVDAGREIDLALAAGKLPVLVGGTMLYFRSLIEGIAELPTADASLRHSIDAEAVEVGWPALHRRLAAVDPVAAARINQNDSQRIQRALEVFEQSGRSLTEWLAEPTSQPGKFGFHKFSLMPGDRAQLHRRIEQRLLRMLDDGFVDEVVNLKQRPALSARHSSMRAVGYRQIWEFIDGHGDLDSATFRALVATRQLAKRQLTWLRADRNVSVLDPYEVSAADAISGAIQLLLD